MKLKPKDLKKGFTINSLFSYTFFVFSFSILVLTVLSFSLISCSGNTDFLAKPTINDPESYFVSTADNILVQAEYGSTAATAYKIKPYESRRIYISGKLGTGQTTTTHGRVWWKYGIQSGGSNIGVDKDCYWDSQSRRYTTWVNFNPTTLISGTAVPIPIHIGTSNEVSASDAQFFVDVISERTYNIKYSYQTGYDIFKSDNSIGYETATRIFNAFEGAATSINITEEVSNLPQSTVLFYDPEFSWVKGSGLALYVKQNIHNPTSNETFRLVSVYDVDPLAVGYWGLTVSGDPAFTHGFSFVFYNRTRLRTGVTRSKTVSYIAVHELSHLRGLAQDLTNTSHLAGHNGTNKEKCAVFDGDYVNLPAIIENPIFCEGHKQFLLNK